MNTQESQTRASASRRLHAMDSAAEFVVTIGGFVVLAAVLGICFYLVWVVFPLFARGHTGEGARGDAGSAVAPWQITIDPYNRSASVIGRDGLDETILLDGGQVVGASKFQGDLGEPSAMSYSRNGEVIAIGYPNGEVQLGKAGYGSTLVGLEEHQTPGSLSTLESGYLEALDEQRGRRVVFEYSFGDPISLKAGAGAVVGIDYRKDPTGKKILAALRQDGTALVNTVRTIHPLGGGADRIKLKTKSFRLVDPHDLPDWFLITADGAHVFCIWKDGRGQRYARVGRGAYGLQETKTLIDAGGEITTAVMLLGGETLLIGSADGSVSSFSIADDQTRAFDDERMLVRTHRINSEAGAVAAISASTRDRSVVIAHEGGVAEIRHMTSEKRVLRIKTGIEQPIAAAISPKNNSLVVIGVDGAYSFSEMDVGYPEFSLKALFGKVHYEGLAAPAYVYQSSSGDDASEIKLSLMPLIFGTLKATIFAMLFAIPIAVLAAIYTSEFVSRRVRRKIKPTVEMMASLPSVVLGFIAAMVVAPFVAQYLETFVIGLVMLPVVILLSAHLWQLVPLAYRLRTRTGHHLLLVGVAVVLGIWASTLIGPTIVRSWFVPDQFDGALLDGAVEAVPETELPRWARGTLGSVRVQRRLREMDLAVVDGGVVRASDSLDHSDGLARLGLAHGSLRRWLNSEYGRARPGWIVAFFPPSCLLVWVGQAVFLRRKLDLLIASKQGIVGNAVVLGKFVVLIGVAFVLADIAATIAVSMGFDPRDSVFGSFSPRNTLVVSIIMGFAVIPIIYTISEDALQAVPMTLRSASLGAGATPWQTAMRVVLPVAASGIFSACMIGFGRAVGETMIVLMATGNTPEMNWNIFSGFRTLAANIAVELPEAPKDETHYRVLFLCGLVLFVMTFVINTAAELVRGVVRARNSGL